jgi:class 3 adenylate cyclase/DNA-binding winged helix-turn-helix (wHTH) protein/tetratricopeptide (TPR) repeat protein
MEYVFGDYTLDTRRYELRRAGVPVPLRPKVFHLLAYLLAHRERVVSRQELGEHLWPRHFVSEATLDACLAQARQAVGDSGRRQQVIQTRHGYGYRFAAAVQVHEGPSREGETASVSATSPPEPPAGEPAQGPVGAAGVPVLVPAAPHTAPLLLTSARPTPPQPLAEERKEVTVLVCTLADAAGCAQRLEAEALHQRMQAFLALVLEEVERYGGTLQRVLDDGALVLFGAPLAYEDHAQRGVLAALAIQRRLQAAHPTPALPSGEVWAVRIGLHTGQLIIGQLGEAGRLTFTSVGETLQLAVELAQWAAPGTIVVSEATARRVQGAVRLEAGRPMPRRGATTPRLAYKVLGLGPRRASLATHAGRPLTPFVGRRLELATLRALLRRVESGQGQVVGIVGEPGMGKTRLVYEFWHSLGSTRVTCLEGHCDAYSQAIPLLPLQDIVRQACGLTEADPAAVTAAQVHRHLQALDISAAEVAPYLLHLLGVPEATAGLAELSPQAIRLRTFAALDRLLLQHSQRGPVLVVVENLHWIDPTSHEYFAELVERIAGVPLLLVTYRPGYRPPWMDKSYATQLTLAQLSPADSQRVVQAVLPARQLPDRLLQDILERAGGNPLFLEELAWTVKEHGGGQLPPEIPTTVQAVLAARIDRLPPEEKRLLQAASVIGMEVPLVLLQAMAERPAEELRRSLTHLQAAEFLYETRLLPDVEYRFKHALTHQVAYGSLLQGRRRELHARIVEALEALAGEWVSGQVDRLAHHALRGELWDKALAYCRQAGEKALARSAYREAVSYFEQALGALAHLPQQRDTLEQAIDLRLALRSALLPSASLGRILAYLREAESLAEALDDPRRPAQVSLFLSDHFWIMGAYDQAIASGRRALALATADAEGILQALANQYLGLAYYVRGDYRRAIDLIRHIAAALGGARRHERFGRLFLPAVYSRAWLAWCHAELGRFAEGRAFGEEGLRIAEAAAQPPSLMIAS